MNRARLEAFSDGVLAVAITLLVLDLHADADSRVSLARQLQHEWPAFGAYVVSFFTVGVIWVNHHALFTLAARIDRAVMFYNLLLLLWVSTIPFTTSTLASYLRSGGGNARVAVLLYGVSMEGMAATFTLILSHLIRRRLLDREVSPEQGRRAVGQFGIGAVLYPLVTSVGLLSAPLMLGLFAVLTGYYITERLPLGAVEVDEVDEAGVEGRDAEAGGAAGEAAAVVRLGSDDGGSAFPGA